MKLKVAPIFQAGLVSLAVLAGSIGLAPAQTNAPRSSGSVRLIDPEDGARFDPGATISLQAAASPGADVDRMEFLLNGRLLGAASNAPYLWVWSNAPAGSYVLSARAFSAAGARLESPGINIRVSVWALTFGLDDIPFLKNHRLFDEPLWRYAASLLYILLAFYVSKLLDWVVNSWLKRLAAKTETKYDDLLLELLHGPVKVVMFVIFLHIGLTMFHWPAAADRFLSRGFILIAAFSVTYAALKLTDMMVGVWRERTVSGTDKTFDDQLFPVVRKSLKVFVVVVAFLVTWQNLSDKPITAILASLSIGGLALGLAAQDTLANLFGAIAVYIDKPFRIGDRIQLDNVDGTVESIGLRSTRVRSLDGHHVTIPNKTVGNATITNITRRPTIKTEVNLGLTCDTPADRVEWAIKCLEEIFRANPSTADLIVTFNKFGDSALNLQVLHWWKGPEGKPYLAAMQFFNLEVKRRFDAGGISLAFPTRTVYVRQDREGLEAQKADPKGGGTV